MTSGFLKTMLLGGACGLMLASPAVAKQFDIPGGDLKVALDAYVKQAGVPLIVASDAVKGARTRGVEADVTAEVALARILAGTGFVAQRNTGAVVITDARAKQHSQAVRPVELAQAAPAHAAASVETVVVTSSKIKGDIQTVPIAITALSQEQLTSRQIAGGPDLVKEVPNLTFSKTNFTGYNIQIRGIGTQAISVTTDPAVAVAFNDVPFIRNHFFEQEFYDVSQVEVLRGPQGTLYGRNATAGVVNVISAKPTDQFEAMLSADWGNYSNRRYEGMVNIPIVDDRLDLRVTGEWTKRDGYSFNTLTNQPIDGRDLWSSRVTLGWKPSAKFQAYLVWEHFQENDDRIRSSKQLCKYDPGPATVLGVSTAAGSDGHLGQEYLSQGCLPVSLYSKDAFETPNSLSLPYYGGLIGADFGQSIASPLDGDNFDAYASKVQSTNLRVIESALNPTYRAKNDTIEFNADYAVTPALTITSQSAFNNDFLWSAEDFNRFNTVPGIFLYNPTDGAGGNYGTFGFGTLIETSGQFRCDDGTIVSAASSCAHPYVARPFGSFCDPQLGCSDRLVAEDLSEEHAWQLSQEFRLASNFSGPLNFSIGGNYLHYETEENYYVFINTLTMYVAKTLKNYVPGVSDNTACTAEIGAGPPTHAYPNPQSGGSVEGCLGYIDPNPIGSLNKLGHNYFLSQNPYVLNSYAGFGEAYYTVTPELKLIGGLRWTDDEKHFLDIPSELLEDNAGYPVTAVVNQQWNEWTGRFTANWTPKLDFTEQTLVYGSYAHGYKAGGANPPGAALLTFATGDIADPVHPLTFKPEFIDAYEMGTKNTALDGALTVNGDIFYYNYKAYQISEIVDRTAINLNFNATVKGAELESSWEAMPGLKFSFAGGYEDTRIDNGQSAVDLMDRTAGNPNWLVVKPFVTQASNCVLPAYVVAQLIENSGYDVPYACSEAYNLHYDPAVGGDSGAPYQADPYPGYPGFDPCAGNSSCAVYALNPQGHYVNTGTIDDPYTGQNIFNGVDYGPAPNNGEGFAKNVGGNQLPNAPHFTTSLAADFTLPVSEDWAATLHGDFYWQSQSFARVFNDRPYDKLRGYSNVNLALILTGASGWQVMGYLKNVFNTTAITGAFLNSDDTDLTTNVFLTDPRLFGVRVTKNW
jgi:iron complex outermembrane receptor protein